MYKASATGIDEQRRNKHPLTSTSIPGWVFLGYRPGQLPSDPTFLASLAEQLASKEVITNTKNTF